MTSTELYTILCKQWNLSREQLEKSAAEVANTKLKQHEQRKLPDGIAEHYSLPIIPVLRYQSEASRLLYT